MCYTQLPPCFSIEGWMVRTYVRTYIHTIIFDVRTENHHSLLCSMYIPTIFHVTYFFLFLLSPSIVLKYIPHCHHHHYHPLLVSLLPDGNNNNNRTFLYKKVFCSIYEESKFPKHFRYSILYMQCAMLHNIFRGTKKIDAKAEHTSTRHRGRVDVYIRIYDRLCV